MILCFRMKDLSKTFWLFKLNKNFFFLSFFSLSLFKHVKGLSAKTTNKFEKLLSTNAMPYTSLLSRHLDCLRDSASLRSQGRLLQRMVPLYSACKGIMCYMALLGVRGLKATINQTTETVPLQAQNNNSCCNNKTVAAYKS